MLSYIATTLACKPVLEITPQVAIPRAQSVSPASGTPNITHVELLFCLHSASLPPFLILYICVSFMYFFFFPSFFFLTPKGGASNLKLRRSSIQHVRGYPFCLRLFATSSFSSLLFFSLELRGRGLQRRVSVPV